MLTMLMTTTEASIMAFRLVTGMCHLQCDVIPSSISDFRGKWNALPARNIHHIIIYEPWSQAMIKEEGVNFISFSDV